MNNAAQSHNNSSDQEGTKTASATQAEVVNIDALVKSIIANPLYIAIIFSLIYGAGWLVLSIAFQRLGVGNIYPYRENAIGCGLLFFLYLLSSCFAFDYALAWTKSDRALSDKLVAVVSIFTVFSGMIYVLLFFFLHSGANNLQFFLAILFPPVGWLAVSYNRSDRTIIQSLMLYSIFSLITWSIFVVPIIKPPFGCFILSQVEVQTAIKTIDGRYVLVASDQQNVVLSRANASEFVTEFPRDSNKLNIVLIPWAHITTIYTHIAFDVHKEGTVIRQRDEKQNQKILPFLLKEPKEKSSEKP